VTRKELKADENNSINKKDELEVLKKIRRDQMRSVSDGSLMDDNINDVIPTKHGRRSSSSAAFSLRRSGGSCLDSV